MLNDLKNVDYPNRFWNKHEANNNDLKLIQDKIECKV